MAARKAPTNRDVVLYVLARLRSAEEKVPTEVIAARCAQIAPDRFAWCQPKYRKERWADLEIVRRALRSAAKRRGPLVKGASSRDAEQDGWTMLKKGVAWFEKNGSRIETALDRGLSVQRGMEADRQRVRDQMDKEPLFRLFIDTGSLEHVTPDDLARMLGASLHGRSQQLSRAFDSLYLQAELGKEADVITFLRACRKQFPRLLG